MLKKLIQPSIAPGIEDDNLEAKASPEEFKEGNYTRVTRLVIDRVSESD
jgi:hypothetical protein